MKLSPFSKAVAGAVISGVAAAVSSLTTASVDGHISMMEWLIAAGALLGSGGLGGLVVYQAPKNTP